MHKDVRWTAILGKIVVILVLMPHPPGLGQTYYMIPFDSDCDTSSPPAMLQVGTAGSSVVYANGTSAGSTVTSLVSSFNPNGYNVMTGMYDSGSTPSSVSAEDSDRFTVNSTGTATSSLNYNPTGYDLLGSTGYVSGSVENLTGDDGAYMVFGSYLSRDTESEEGVDSDSSNVDSSQDRGSSSNFTAQQTGPDSEFDTLTEEYFGGVIEDYVDVDTSDVDSSADTGTHSNFANQKLGPDSVYDTLQEDNALPSSEDWGINSSAFTSTSTHAMYRYMGGTSPDKDNMTVTKLHIRVNGPGTVAIAIYTGGALDDPTGAVKQAEAYNITVSTGWNEIDVTDFNWSKNTVTWIGWAHNTGVYYSSSSGDCGDYQAGRGRWSQTSPADADETQPMPGNPGAGSFGNYWYAVYAEYEIEPEYQIDLEVQWTGLPSSLPNEELCIYTGSTDAEDIIIDIWDTGASEWDTLLSDLSSSTWNNVSISSWLTSDTVTIRFKGSNETGDVVQDQWNIDVALIHMWSSDTARYRLDLEFQWTGVSYDEANEYLCIYGGSQGSEDIRVDVWYSSSWQNVLSDLSSGWNNVSVGSYLTDSTFTVRFKGGTDGSDTVKDPWQADFSMLHLWTKQHTSEVELRGSGDLLEWTQLNWTVDSRWTSGSISVILQLYDYDNQSYPGSGDGYMGYTSGPADTDETKFGVISSNPEHFRNGTGWWKVRVKGVLNLDTQFNMSLDLVDFEATHYSEYTASTEFLFDDVTDNQSPFLNFTVVSHNSRDGATVTIQVWNYTTSSYPVGGEGYLSYSSDGVDLTRHLNITTNPSSCLSGSNAKIRITAENMTTEAFQQLVNKVRLLQAEKKTLHDYVLNVQSQEASLWQVRLRAYGEANIQVLENCTVYFMNETSQVVVLDGAYDQSTGGWTNLPGLDSLHIVVDVSSLRVGAAKLLLYLDVRVPGTSSYASYVIHLKITQ